MSDKGVAVPSLRSELRSKLLASRQRKRVKLKVWDEEVEMVQPTVKEFMNLTGVEARELIAELLIRHCLVPGTDEPVFEEGDKESILNWPVGSWLEDTQKAYSELTNLKLEEREKNSEKTV